jgi:hypothetical protein
MLRRKSVGHRSMQKRCLRLETLETRAMLSHPAVTAVNVAGTDWTSSFVSHLESAGLGVGGYAIPVGSSAQLRTLPWTNINQIRITFSEDVVVVAADLSVSGVNTTARTFSGFTYDSTSHTAVWTLAAPITKDKLLLDLDADGMAPIISISTGEALSGGWTNCVSSFPSGNGQDVADFEFGINALPGDVDGTNSVTTTDAFLVRAKIGKTVNDLDYNIRYDVDGSGTITTSDYDATRLKISNVLPSGNPAGMTNDAPTTAGIPEIFFDTGGNTTDYVLSLPDLFADAETLSDDMVYTIVNNTNPSLFDSLSIDSSGALTVDLPDNADGDATLTVRATDAGGLIVETSFVVHASNAPFITDFYCINETGDFWTITGAVTDYDSSVVGDVVTFGGVFANFNLSATITSVDGVFTFTFELPGLAEGVATAQTQDSHGIMSNVAVYWVTV